VAQEQTSTEQVARRLLTPGVPMRVPPLLLLDVDGVLNALGRPLPGDWPDFQVGTATAAGRDYVIAWSPEVVARLVGWHASGRAEVQWLTTWGHDANRSLRHLLGMPELVVAGTFDHSDAGPSGEPDPGTGALAAVTPAARDELTGRWWKFDVVRRIVREQPDRRLVWIDDDLAGEDDLRRWARQNADCLPLAPPPRSGLRPDDLLLVEAWLDLRPAG
jgi:hypothetical protein